MARLEIDIVGNIDGLTRGLSDAQKQLNAFASKIQGIGKGLSLAVTAPLIGLAAIGIRNFDKQAQAIGQIEAALESTGNAAGRTSKELQKAASELQAISTFGDEEILQGLTAQLLTFTNIAGSQFDKTQKAALDLATRLGGDLQSAAIQLGKALNDPVANLSALSRSGIQFSKEQKELINSLVETNRLAEAQDIILAELEKQYGGSAEAAAKLGLGPLKQLGNQFGDLLEDVGEIILKGINPFIDSLKGLTSFLQSLSPITKTIIVVIGGLVASIGPMLLAFGTFIKLIPIINAGLLAMKTAVIAATGPFGLIAIAIAAAIPLLINLNNELKRTSQIAGEVKAAQLEENFKNIKEEVEGLSKRFQELDPGLTATEATNKAIDSVIESYKKLYVTQLRDGNLNAELLNKQIKYLIDYKKEINKAVVEVEGLGNSVKLTFEEFSKLADLANEKVFAAFTADADAYNAELEETISLQRRIQEGLSGIKGGGIVDVGVNLGENAPVIETAEIDDSSLTRFVLRLQEFNAQINDTLSQGIANTIGDFAFAIGDALATGGNVLKAGGAALLGGLASILNQLGQLAIQAGVAIAGIKISLKTLNPAVAIGAGIALVALAGFVSAKARALSGASGGSSGTGVMSQGGSFGGGGGNLDFNKQVQLVGEWTVSGDQLRYVIANSENFKN